MNKLLFIFVLFLCTCECAPPFSFICCEISKQSSTFKSFCFEKLIGEQLNLPINCSSRRTCEICLYIVCVFSKSSMFNARVCSSAVWVHVSVAPLPGCWNMVIVRIEYPCARFQFNESHLWHICTFIPLQGEIVFPKQSLPPR